MNKVRINHLRNFFRQLTPISPQNWRPALEYLAHEAEFLMSADKDSVIVYNAPSSIFLDDEEVKEGEQNAL